MAHVTENPTSSEDWGTFMGVMYNTHHFFDLTTGEEMSYTAFLKDGWQEAGEWATRPFVNSSSATVGVEIDPPDLSDATLAGFWISTEGVEVTFRYPDILKDWVSVTVPIEYVNWNV
jgi:hypothetical protein